MSYNHLNTFEGTRIEFLSKLEDELPQQCHLVCHRSEKK